MTSTERGSRMSSRRNREAPMGVGAVPAFLADVRGGWAKLFKRTSDMHLRIVLLVILAGVGLRLLGLRLPVTHDEALTYAHFASRSFHVVFTDLSYPVNHVFHTALVRVSTSMFGAHLWSLRLPALLAGIFVMPLFYLFVRSMFNRYIAMLVLGLVASSGCLIEQSSLAQGYSVAACCYVLALVLGRHLSGTNNLLTALLLALVNALALWTVPTMLYGVVAVHIWLVIQISVRYKDSVNRRLAVLAFSGLLCLVLTSLLYMPIISVYGIGSLFHHPTQGNATWETFLATQQDRAFDLWAYFNDTSTTWISLLGAVGIGFAVYISSKYRALLLALVLGTVPLVILLARVGAPGEWSYLQFMLHLGSGIALFYLLKFVQDRVHKGFAKRMRTVLATLTLMVVMSMLGLQGIKDRIERFPEAAYAADWFQGILHPGDRVLVEFPWEAPLEFHFLVNGMGREALRVHPSPDKALYVLVGPGDGQTLEQVLDHHRFEDERKHKLEKVQDWRRLEIYAAR